MNARPVYYIPVHGTWAIDEQHTAWWKPTGPFALFAERNNVFQWSSLPPFIWSSDISGFSYNLQSGNRKHTDWRAGGWALYYYLNQVPIEHRNLVIHSHGLQVALYCASFGMEINNVVSVCAPIRDDMSDISEAARFKFKNWLHIYDNNDKIGWLGQFGDGKFFGSRKSAHATTNEKLSGVHHSDLLKIGGKMDAWVKNGWFDYLRQ